MATPLSISNPHPRRLPGPTLLHELIPRESRDGSAAIEHTDADGQQTTLTYSEFHARANVLARQITSNLGRHSSGRLIIPLLIPQSPDLYISQLATLKAGGAFCPIVLDAPQERLRFILQDIDASILLTTAAHKSQLPHLEGVRILAVDEWPSTSDNDHAELEVTVRPQDAAYIMYTSGSTGQPKGVILSHSAATQALLAHDLHIPKFSRFLQFASPTFDVSVFEIFFPWLRHATLVSCDRRRLLNDLPSAIAKLKIDACELTPSVASSLLQGRESVPSLKVLLTIGEMLKPSVVEEFGGDDDTPAILHGMYGPTEATIHCTLQTYFPKDMSCGAIGIPLDTVSAFVIRIPDESSGLTFDLEILPLGEEGELAVGGYQLADGYLNRDEKTREVFVEHPEYGLLYRTGDRARMLPEGKLECLGRISSGQVKLRGQRIELGEIEHAASRTPGCRDVAAEVISGILVVFCVRGNDSLNETSILETCRKWLPEFMLPGNVIIIPSLPYLASGKCDRKTLRAEYERSQTSDAENDGAISDHERMKQVTSVLSDVLGQTVAAATILSAIGVDSLSSIRIATALRKHGLPQLDAAQILSARTSSDIIAACDRALVQREDIDDSYRNRLDFAIAQALPGMQDTIETSFPCTPVQVAMLTETERDSRAYCNWVELLISGDQEVSDISKAIEELARAHPLLRSGFAAVDGVPWSFATVVWKHLLPNQIKEVSETCPSLKIDSQGALLRPCSFSLMPCKGGVRVLVELHHAMFDQWSMDIFRSDLLAILRGRDYRNSGSFKAVSDYYVSSQDKAESAVAIDFWQDNLRDVRPTAVPLLRYGDAPDTLKRTSWRELSISTADVKSNSSRLGCSAPAVFQAAMVYLLGSYAGTTDVTLGSVFSGRTIPVPDVDAVFGPCLATLPFRMDLSTVATAKDLLQAVTDRNRAIQNHVDASPTFIRRAAGILPGVKLFDSLFIWQESTVPEAPGDIEVLDTSADRLEFSLVLEFEPSPTAIKARATYRQSLVSEEHVDVMLRQVEALSTHLMEASNSSVDEIGSCLSRDLLSMSQRVPANCDASPQPEAKLTLVLEPESHLHILPRGAYGEIAIGIENHDGKCLDPAKMLKHPEHGQMYRSGNVGRMLPDGTVVVAGKLEDHVKIGGCRIDLTQIDAALARSPNVAECATAVCTEQESRQTIVGFWTPVSGDRGSGNRVTVLEAGPRDTLAMFDQLDAALQPHMVPSTLLPLSRLPKTREGKSDKEILQKVFSELNSKQREPFSRSHETVDGPISFQEQTAAECLAEVLGIPCAIISRTSTFSTLGMTSQNETRLSTLLETRLNNQFDGTKVSGDSSIAQLCRTSPLSGSSTGQTDAPVADGTLTYEEQTVANALAEILDIPVRRISRTSSFFALGVNSLNAIQLVRSLKKRLNAEIGVSTILSHPSIAKLCRTLSEHQDGNSEKPSGLNIHEVIHGDFTRKVKNDFATNGHTVEAILPCTPLQQAMLSATASVHGDAYCDTMKLNGLPDITRFKQCWTEMTARHEILRTCFAETPLAAHPFAQVLLKEQPCTWTDFSDESAMNGTNGHTDLDIDRKISSGMPLRLDKRGPDLYLRMHHALYDGVSVSNLFSEMVRLYNGERLPSPVSFEPFLQVVLAQNGQDSIKFWSTQMEEFTPHPFPPLETNITHQVEKTIVRRLSLRPTTLSTFSERHFCTSSVVLQAAWAKTLACLQEVTDICFGNVVSGRSVAVPNVERLIAPCFNTVPLRTNLSRLRTNMDLIGHLQEMNVKIMPHQLTALGRIRGLTLEPTRHLFESLLLVQPPKSDTDEFFTEEGEMDMGIPVVVEVIPDHDEFELKIHFLENRVPESIIPTLMDAFEAALASCIRYPASSLEHFMEFDSAQIASKLKASAAPAKPNANSGDSDYSSSAGWTTDEQVVRQVFAELAGVDPSTISKSTSLYRIGLDSLNAVQVASKLRSKGFKVDAADVMQRQSPEALAALVTPDPEESETVSEQECDFDSFDEAHREHFLRATDISDDVLEAVRPCTAAQSGMLSQFVQSSGEHYLNHTLYEVPASHSFAAIESAWATVQQKHQVLRMGFSQLDQAATPFAMAIYKAGSYMNRIVTSSTTADFNDLKRQVGKEILRELHLPAWRVALIEHQGKKQMCVLMHHSLYDADSLQILLGDFAKALQSTDIGPATSIDQSLRTQIEGAMNQKDASEEFWRSALGSVHLVKFPNLTPTIVRQRESSCICASCSFDVSTLSDYCKKMGVTIQAVGQTAWGRLLAAYTGESDVTFGTVFSGASSSTANPEAFPSISTVPVHYDSSQKMNDALNAMVSYNASAQRHRFTPLSDIQRFADAPGQPLFDTIFVYQKSHQSNESLKWPVIQQSLGIDYVASLEMEVSGPEAISLRLHFDTQIIPEEHASLMIRQFDSILSGMIGDEHLDIDQTLLSISPPKESTLPSPVGLLHQFLERGSRQYPDRPALEFITSLDNGAKGRKKWTYQQVNERSNQVAHIIDHHNVRPGGVVAVCMSKSAEATFAFAGILKAGCAFLAMDPDLPLARRKFIIEDSGCQLLFVDHGLSDLEMREIVDQVELTEEHIIEFPSQTLRIPPTDPQSTCYILYTSGTTGTPKGCELTHDNAVQAMMAFQRLFAGHWTQDSRWLQFASYWFDVSVLEQFWSWSVGITVVGAPRDLVLEDLAGFITKVNITHIDLTPSLARLLKPEDVKTLWNHVFITGGESLKQEIIDAWGSLNTIYNGYGPTEATIGVTMNPHLGPDAKPSNIGPPFDNVGAFVFAPGTDEPVLRGAVGELCVSGRLVGKGYLNRPDLTKKAFPYLERFQERVYRTGDLVRLLADGSVSFIGRQDSQAKLRGQRLEIDEVDAVIKQSSEGISDVASLVVKSEEGSKEMLVSFIVDREASHREVHVAKATSSQQLVLSADAACRNRLPGYMVPTHIVPISRLPLTVNNKIDTRVLIALFKGMSNSDLQALRAKASESKSLGPAEKRIAKVLSKLLSIKMDDIRSDSNVFSLGLSSVSAINFASSLKRNGFSGASVTKVMRNPTLDRLSTSLSSDKDAVRTEANAAKQAHLSVAAYGRRYRSFVAETLSVSASQIEMIAPCTPLQEGLLTESIKSSKRPYFNEFWFDVKDVDKTRLLEAIRRLYDLVPMLRTAFVRTDEGYSQAVLAQQKCPLETFSLEENEIDQFVAERKAEWQAETDDHFENPFKTLLIETTSKAVLVFFIHHALYDGISWELIIFKLQESYKTGRDIDAGPSFFDALPFGPLSSRRAEAKTFWSRYLDGVQSEPLPRAGQDGSDKQSSTQICVDNSEGLERIRRELGVSHQAVFQAAFAVALHQFAPQVQSYGLVLSGRSIGIDRADEVIGPLFNTVPCAVNLHSSVTWQQYLQSCQVASAEVLPFQHTSLREIRKFCNRPPSDPMFDTIFVFQQPASTVSGDRDGLFQPIERPSTAEFGLAIEVDLNLSGAANVTITAQAAIANDAATQQLAHDFRKALSCIVHSPKTLISELFQVQQAKKGRMAKDLSRVHSPTDSAHDFEWTKEATMLREMIAQVAECDLGSVTEHAAIFGLGLDSIDAVKLASRLKRAGISLPVSKILQAQTITKMLDVMRSQVAETDRTDEPNPLLEQETQLQALREAFEPVLRKGVERVLPVAPGQEALIADMLRSELHQYYNFDILHLRNDVDLDKLKSAWQAVVDAHPILRTSFIEVTNPDIDVVFAQLVHRPAPLDFNETEISDLSDLQGYIDVTRSKVLISYSRQSPLRLCIATVSSERYLVLSLAHAQYDGHSLGLLHEDVLRAYHNEFKARPSYDTAISQALDATGQAAIDFWRGNLSGAKTVRFCDGSDIHLPDAASHRVERTSVVPLADARSRCQKAGITLPALAQASWGALLANHVQELDVIFGVVLACRDSEEAENLMFPTMNTVPMRVPLHGTGEEMLRDVQDAINKARPFQRTPLRAIQAACAGVVQHHGSDNALIDTLFIYQQGSEQTASGTSSSLYESVDANSNVEFPVAIEVEIVHDRLVIRAACKDYALDEEGAISLLERYDQMLEFFVFRSEKPTVEFLDSQISICGLAPFKQYSDIPSSQSTIIDNTESEDENDEDSPLISTICQVMAQVSKMSVEDISANATIESIGIDSISAIKVTALLRKMDIKISVSDLLKAQTPRRMAGAVKTAFDRPMTNGNGSHSPVAGALERLDLAQIQETASISNDQLEAVLPATAGQMYMLAMWRKSNGQMFHLTFKYHIKTPASTDELSLAWKATVRQHGILRTVFCATRDAETPLLQFVLKPDAEGGPKSANEHAGVQQPLVEFQSTKARNGHEVELKIHHALYDAVSLPLLMQDFQGHLTKQRPDTPTVAFEDFVSLSASPAAQKSCKDFWTDYIRNVRSLRLARPEASSSRRVQIFKPNILSSEADLERCARKARVTMQAMLFASYAKVYARHAAQKLTKGDVVLGIYIANRAHIADLDRLAAPTLNLLPLIVRSPLHTSLLSSARKIDRDLRRIGTAENAAVSLESVSNWSQGNIRIDSFVNFLRLPASEDSAVPECEVALTQTSVWDEGVSKVDEPTDSDALSVPEELKGFKPGEAYDHALDIELSQQGNKLSMGLFCLEDMMSLDEGESLVKDLAQEIEESLQ